MTLASKICPNTHIWHLVYLDLLNFAKTRLCSPPQPPEPLILNSWISSSDLEKSARWKSTLEWCRVNGCENLLANLSDDDFYYAAPSSQ